MKKKVSTPKSEPGKWRTTEKAIMFSKKVCYFFIRPQKTFLEVVIFLPDSAKLASFKSVRAVSKNKYAHVFKLIHEDQVDGELTSAIARAYQI